MNVSNFLQSRFGFQSRSRNPGAQKVSVSQRKTLVSPSRVLSEMEIGNGTSREPAIGASYQEVGEILNIFPLTSISKWEPVN